MYGFVLSDTASVFTSVIMGIVGRGIHRLIVVTDSLTVCIAASTTLGGIGTSILTATMCNAGGLRITTSTDLPVVGAIVPITAPRMIKRTDIAGHVFAATDTIAICATVIGTSRCLSLRPIRTGMPQRRNGTELVVATMRTISALFTGYCAGGFFRYIPVAKMVTRSRNTSRFVMIANSTVSSFNTILSFGRCLDDLPCAHFVPVG